MNIEIIISIFIGVMSSKIWDLIVYVFKSKKKEANEAEQWREKYFVEVNKNNILANEKEQFKTSMFTIQQELHQINN